MESKGQGPSVFSLGSHCAALKNSAAGKSLHTAITYVDCYEHIHHIQGLLHGW